MSRSIGLVRIFTIASVALLALSPTASADTPASSDLNVRVSATQTPPETPIYISASGFQAGEHVAVVWEVSSLRPGRPVTQILLAETQADAQGLATLAVTFPSKTTTGQQLLLIQGLKSRQSAHLVVSVQTNWDRFSCSLGQKGKKAAK